MNPTIFLTGATSGIGAALATHYLSSGAKMGVFGRNADAFLRLNFANLASKHGTFAPQVLTSIVDVCDARAMQSATQSLIASLGVPDIVIANAGVSRGTLAGAMEDVAAFQQVIDTNVLGMVNTFTPVIDAMVARGSGTLVGIASVAGLRGTPGAAAYGASKAAAIAYCEALRVELRGTGVKVVTICPGFIDTPMTQANGFAMPFMLSAEDGARRIAHVIDAQKAFAIVPWQMAIVGRIMRALPNPVYDYLAARAPRKPR